MGAGAKVRRVVILSLEQPPKAKAEAALRSSAAKIRDGDNSERLKVASQLERFADGEDPYKIFVMKRKKGRPDKAMRNFLIAMDHQLRKIENPKVKKLWAHVGSDWSLEKKGTIDGILKDYRPLVRAYIQHLFEESESLGYSRSETTEDYLEAVARARTEFLTGKRPAVEITREEPIDLVVDWSPVLLSDPIRKRAREIRGKT